jgi:hypothetical protein
MGDLTGELVDYAAISIRAASAIFDLDPNGEVVSIIRRITTQSRPAAKPRPVAMKIRYTPKENDRKPQVFGQTLALLDPQLWPHWEASSQRTASQQVPEEPQIEPCDECETQQKVHNPGHLWFPFPTWVGVGRPHH